MKKVFRLRLWAAFLLLLVSSLSCRKNNDIYQQSHNLINNESFTADEIITPEEISKWLQAQPISYTTKLIYSQAQQIVIQNKHVIKIPVSENAAMFFSKRKGVLNAWAYRESNRTLLCLC